MDRPEIAVLVIEDDAFDYEALCRLLRIASTRRQEPHYQTVWAKDVPSAIEEIKKSAPDIILLDLLLPGADGLSSLKSLKEFAPQLPIIMMTSLDDQECAIEALKYGAQDYLLKDKLDDQITRPIRYAIERQQIMRQLSETERQARIAKEAESRFLAHMSHEIRTPLTAIIGYGEMLIDPSQSPQIRTEASSAVVRSSRHLLELVNDILDFSKIESGQLELEKVSFPVMSIMYELKEAFQEQAAQKKLVFSVEQEGPLPIEMHSDPLRIRQVLFNLVSNAIKFTARGEVHVVVKSDRKQGLLRFAVHDTGIGLNQEQIGNLFRPFCQGDSSTTRRFGGTGLGLVISKDLCERLGGTIQCESTPGSGSAFHASFAIEIPGADSITPGVRATAEFGQLGKSNVTKPPQLSGSILIAEDCLDNQSLLRHLIGKTGATLEIVENGEIAVQRAKIQTFDLVFMDLSMPVMDGIQAVKALRAHGYQAPIVALTACTTAAQKQECSTAGFDDYVTKPFDQGRLYRVIDKFLNREKDASVTTSSTSESSLSISEIVQGFVEHLPGKIATVEQAYATHNWPALAAAAHRLAGAEMFGFAELGNTARALEDAALQTDGVQCEKLLLSLKLCADAAIQAAPPSADITASAALPQPVL
jgi:signal transduction histidine kinase/HPt (histidine-containing phosphotransfer) domain-containing protein